MGEHNVRLAFKGNTVVEAKNMKTGATADQKKKGKTLISRGGY